MKMCPKVYASSRDQTGDPSLLKPMCIFTLHFHSKGFQLSVYRHAFNVKSVRKCFFKSLNCEYFSGWWSSCCIWCTSPFFILPGRKKNTIHLCTCSDPLRTARVILCVCVCVDSAGWLTFIHTPCFFFPRHFVLFLRHEWGGGPTLLVFLFILLWTFTAGLM